MELYATDSKAKYRVYFNKLETNNLVKALGEENISIRNLQLCYYIEKTLPKKFKECRNKRAMVLNIFYNRSCISAVVLLQNTKYGFFYPKEKTPLFKITQVEFNDGYAFKNWIKDKKYMYKILDVNPRNVKVNIFNVNKQDEMSLASADAKIVVSSNIAKYIFVKTTDKLEKCFN